MEMRDSDPIKNLALLYNILLLPDWCPENVFLIVFVRKALNPTYIDGLVTSPPICLFFHFSKILFITHFLALMIILCSAGSLFYLIVFLFSIYFKPP